MTHSVMLCMCTDCWGTGKTEVRPERLGYTYLGTGSHGGHVYRAPPPSKSVCVLMPKPNILGKPTITLKCGCPAGDKVEHRDAIDFK
jgi:hypothetical protein